jgi:hypothetical protein
LRFALGIVLLSDVSFAPTYRSIHQFPVLQAGVAPMNTSFLNTDWFNVTATDVFWWNFPSILADGKVSRAVDPISCSGESCTAFFLPGAIQNIIFDPTFPNISNADYSTATSYIQQNAPGYQIDFYPIEETDPPLTLDDCRVYGVTDVAVQVCLKKSNSSLLAGIPFIEI